MNLRALMLGTAMALTLVLSARAQAASINGHWEGNMFAHGASLPVSFDLAQSPHGLEGRFTSPTQAAMDYPLDKAVLNATHVAFTLGGSIEFDGTLNGDAISGAFKNGDMSGTIALNRTPIHELPYDTKDVSFRNGEVTLNGTLCIPRSSARHPAVVLLQGSGPQSRWGTTRYIADRLARAGVMALTYDKRGSGDSGGDWRTATYADLANDALAGVALLDSRSDVDASHVGFIGHSQGAVIAALAATLAPHKVGFIVAEDGFVGPQRDQDIYRVRAAIRELNLSPTDLKNAMDTYTLFVDAARGARPYEDFKTQSDRFHTASWYDWMDFPARDSWVWAWARKNGSFDSLPVWRAVRAPTLLIYGEKDALGPVDQDIAETSDALAASNTPFAAFIVPNAQHNLTIQPEPHGPFFWWHQAPGVIDTVVAWVKQQGTTP
jgi:pimeloyl-ACP methyl ester carboxylesterase